MKYLSLTIIVLICICSYSQVPGSLTDSDSTMNIPGIESSGFKEVDIEGLYSTMSLGYLFGPGGLDPACISITIAYQFEEHYSFGIGSGIEFFNEPETPLYGEIKYTFEGMKVAPFLFLQTGYSFPLKQPDGYYYWYGNQDAKGGIMVNPEAGILVPLNSSVLFHFNLGFRYQELNYHERDWTDQIIYRTDYFKRLSVNFGICFK